MSERCETDKTPQAKANATDKFNSIARHNQRHCLFDNAATTNQAIFSAIFNSLLDTANETDVREEIAMPILSLLGYQRGTANDILRESPLKYPREFLGRKKKTDPPLRGIPDYVLKVTGAGRWVLEVKAPNVEIGQNEIEQAITYARHPEVSATYAAVLNGRRIVIFHHSQRSEDDPVLDFNIESPAIAAQKLTGVLSPPAIRRVCNPPKVDVGIPLAEGLRSSAEIRGGNIGYSDYQWNSSHELPSEFAAQQEEVRRGMLGYRTDITGGKVWRGADDRIRATLEWSMPHIDLLQFARDKKLQEVEYVALSGYLSSDPGDPDTFSILSAMSESKKANQYSISSGGKQSTQGQK